MTMASTLAPTRLLQAFRARQLRIRHPCHRGFEILIDPKALSKKQSKKRRGATSSKPSYRFVDKTRVRVMGGSGGKGSLSQEVLRRGHKMRPDGGHGGHGGSVILVADPSEQSLRWSHPHMKGEDGTNGSSKEKLGRNGKNLIIRVPCGVVVRRIVLPGDEGYEEADFLSDRSVGGAPERPEAELSDEDDIDFDDWNIDHDEDNNTGVEFFALDDLPLHEEDEVVVDSAPAASSSHDDNDDEWFAPRPVRKRVYMGDLDKPGAYTLVARGGRAGSGTMVYASEHGPLPDARELIASAQPLAGEVTHLELELKLIADIGLVGFPNAGKSSLLRAMSRAAPEVAPYPFTTLHPLMGVIEYRDGLHVKMADIPGLIEGASEGRGCGHDFLRHVERTKALMYIVDLAGNDGRDPHEDLRILVDELCAYGDGTLLERDALVVANKIDLIEPDRLASLLASIEETADSLGIERTSNVAGISAGVTGEGLDILSKDIRQIAEQFESYEASAH